MRTLLIALITTLATQAGAGGSYTIGQIRGYCQEEEKRSSGKSYDELIWGVCIGFFHGYKSSSTTTCRNTIGRIKNKTVVSDEMFWLLAATPYIGRASVEEIIQHFLNFSNQEPQLWDTNVFSWFNSYLIDKGYYCTKSNEGF